MKIIIPAGGRGTRLLPVTKTIAKEMLPLTDRPLIQYLVEEAAEAGFTEAIIVRSPEKKNMELHFKDNKALEKALGSKKAHFLESVKKLKKRIKIKFAVQKRPLGDGDALLAAKWKTGRQPFAVLFGDTLFDAKTPVMKKLLQTYTKTGSTVIGVKEVPAKDVSRYGIVATEKEKGNLLHITKLVEKPTPKQAPSNLAIVGAYVLSKNIWKYLKSAPHSKDGELRLADGLTEMLKHEKVYACPIKEDWLDTGDYAGYFRANLRLSKRHPRLGKELKKIMREEIK